VKTAAADLEAGKRELEQSQAGARFAQPARWPAPRSCLAVEDHSSGRIRSKDEHGRRRDGRGGAAARKRLDQRRARLQAAQAKLAETRN